MEDGDWWFFVFCFLFSLRVSFVETYFPAPADTHSPFPVLAFCFLLSTSFRLFCLVWFGVYRCKVFG